MLAIINGRVLLPQEQGGHFTEQRGLAVLVEGERIHDIVPQQRLAADMEVLDAGGRYVAPGFIDLHIHGFAGADAMDGTGEALGKMRQGLPSTGVTAFLPTTMTCPWADIEKALSVVRQEMGRPAGGAEVLGAYLEGPFISAAHQGAQKKENIRRADFSLLEPWLDTLKYVVLAPEELQGDYSFVADCRRAGIIVSMGHTDATYEQALEAYEQGVRHATHLFNAMPPLHHRRPGAVGAALDTDCVAELIADGIHLAPAALRLVWRAKGGENIVLITDSMRACGMGDGPSELGGQQVFVKGPLATLADGTIAGSVATMNHVVKTFAEAAGIGLPGAVELATRVPAEEMGCGDERGSLKVGSLADIVIFDENIAIHAAMVRGKIAYQA